MIVKITIDYNGNLQNAKKEIEEQIAQLNCYYGVIGEPESFDFRVLKSEVE